MVMRPCLGSSAYPMGHALTATGSRCSACSKAHQAQRGSTTSRGYGTQWQVVRLAALERDAHTCHWCGGPANTVDHLLAKVNGGSDDMSNLCACCSTCNSSRGGRTRR